MSAPLLSVDEIIRRHPRERLFVQPVEWTGRHLELLQCSFELRDDEEAPGRRTVRQEGQDADPSDCRPFNYWTHEAESLATSDSKNAVIRRILTDRNGPFKCTRPFGFFHFGSDHTFRLHGLVFAPRSPRQAPGQDQPRPVFAFMQRGMIRIQRETAFPLPRPRRRQQLPNLPVAATRRLQLKHLEPTDPCRDPYILAVLLGLAQAQAEASSLIESGSANAWEGREYKVCATFVDEEDTHHMNLYSANISVAFLSKFDYPKHLQTPQSPPLSSSLVIQQERFLYKPYSSLRQRLIDAITTHTELLESAAAET
ncbi:hypothetical protein EDB81DRAFT_144979 [Dactylonectria macrodidyma]|uniref:Uncharacterized protein n=1 Tax=Dactylonectria macrodidyma TaxID=307937 RepID=A0A9P9IM69_9HYPO|nr:hypothetical protein EDB81DRAFT_144979 [Dactylonectria macrodidyma]